MGVGWWLLVMACSEPKGSDEDATAFNPLGDGELEWVAILTEDDKLSDPRDLGFDGDGRLWVANRRDDRTFIIDNPGTEDQSVERRKDGYAQHFMEETAALAFDDDHQFASCNESLNTYNDRAAPNFFMGPALWTTDLEIFANTNPMGLGSHIDMLHESPLCVGVAWEVDNVYWVFDGYHGTIVRYDFQVDHGPGMDDHADGIVYRLREPEVLRVANAPGHMELDRETGLLYIADTGNNRVLWLDTQSGERGETIPQNSQSSDPLMAPEPLQDYAWWEGVDWGVLIEGIDQPGSLALAGDRLYVGEHNTGKLSAYTLDGDLLQTYDTELGAGKLFGVEVGPDDHLYLTETATPGVWRLDP